MKNLDGIVSRLAERNVRMAVLTAALHWAPAVMNALLVASIWVRLRPRALGWFERQLLQRLAMTAGASGFAWAGANRPEFDAATLDVTGMSWAEAKAILSDLFADGATIDETEAVVEQAAEAAEAAEEETDPDGPMPVRIMIHKNRQGVYSSAKTVLLPGVHLGCSHMGGDAWVADLPKELAARVLEDPSLATIKPFLPATVYTCEQDDEVRCALHRTYNDMRIAFTPIALN